MVAYEVREDLNKRVLNNEIDTVNYKIALRLEVKERVSKDYVRSIVRGVASEVKLPIRYRVDLGEDVFFEQDDVEGIVLAVWRIKHDVNLEDLGKACEGISENLSGEVISIKGMEMFDVGDFFDITEKFDRSVYEMKVEVDKDIHEDYGEWKGKWAQKVVLWDGTVEERDVKGKVRYGLEKLESESPVYKVTLDVPHGVDVYEIMNKELRKKKRDFKGYPMVSKIHYKEPTSKRVGLRDKKCKVTGDPVEKTVGGFIGDQSIYATYF